VPGSPFSGLRVDTACWLPLERLADPRRETRTTIAEYSR
jgi:hypothetical protein